jgi:hypothetical protein
MRYRIILLTFFLTTNCNEKSRITNLIFEDDIDKINISEGALTRNYVNGKKTIKFNLEPNDINDFFNYLIKKRIEIIEPKDLNNECEQVMMPAFSNRLEITFDNGKTYRFDWTTNNCGERVDDLGEIVEQLYLIIKKDKTVEQLERTDMIFE